MGLKVIDIKGNTLKILNFDTISLPTSDEVLDALSTDLVANELFIIPFDFLSWELTGTTYSLYSGDILLRQYDPMMNVLHMICYFEKMHDKWMFSSAAATLILYIEKCKT